MKEERAKQRQSATLPKEGEKGFQAVCGSNDPDIGRARDIVAIEPVLACSFPQLFFKFSYPVLNLFCCYEVHLCRERICCRKTYKSIVSIIELHKVNECLETCNMVQVEKEMPRIRVFATIREDVLRWVDQQVDRARFRNRSHAIEYALIKLMESEKKE